MFLAIPSANPDNGLALLCGSTQPPALFPSSMEVLLKIHMEKLQVVTSKINFIYRFSGTAWQIDKEWVWYKGGLVKDDLVLDQHWKTSHHLVCVGLEVQIFSWAMPQNTIAGLLLFSRSQAWNKGPALTPLALGWRLWLWLFLQIVQS